MFSKCSVVNYHTVLLAFASTVSPTASPKSSEKLASSRRPENGQRLAGNVGNPYLTGLWKGCPSSAQNYCAYRKPRPGPLRLPQGTCNMLHSLFCILLISNVLLSFGEAQGKIS